MKFACLLGFLLSFMTTLHSQDITGIWRGTFYSGYGIYKQEFKYEIQIDQLDARGGPGSANAIKGITYSYRMTSFYGKARFVGIYNNKVKELTLTEDTLVEVKMDPLSFSCLMTCYLEYHKMGDKEVLEGTFSSIVTASHKDCGNGSVYLERVQESDFHKEDFLLKKKPDSRDLVVKKPAVQQPKKDSSATVKNPPPPVVQQKKPAPPATNNPPVAKQNTPQKQQTVVKQPTKPATNNSTAQNNKPAAKQVASQKPQPSASNLKKPSVTNSNKPKKPADIAKPPVIAKTDSALVKTTPVVPPAVVTPPTELPITKRLPPVPDVIKQRENPLVRTIVTNTPDILIELYDNGEIDGDTITVYHNNEVVAFKKGLTTKPITIKVKATPDDAHHEFVMVADNLGSIPPNTALMVVRTGGRRYELFISSNEQKNAKVIIDYQPDAGGK